MKILRRYILREHMGPFIAALAVLTGLMLLNQLARRFGDLVSKGLPWYVIGEVFALSLPFIIAMTMPMAVLVAVLYAFSRLTGDNEITAFKAGGVSLLRLLAPVLIAASVLAAVMVFFNDRVLPESNHALRQLLTDIGRKQPTFELRERVVNEVATDKLFLQAARIDRMRSVLYDLVIFDMGRSNTYRTIYADSGHMAFNQNQTDLYLTLYDGSMHELDTQDRRMGQRTYYKKQVIRVEGVSNELERGASGDWRGDREMSIAMMREVVEERTERFGSLQDSLNDLISTLAPVRYSAAETRPPTRAKRQKPTEMDSITEPVQENLRRGPVDAVHVSPAPAEDAEARDSTSPNAARLRQLRKRFSPNLATQWPPTGDPASFAASIRSQFERSASRTKLQRREINKYLVEIEKKYAIPVAAIVFVLIGAPVAVRFPRGGIGMVIGVSLVVFCVYYVFLIGGEDIADRGFMSPFWAMWAPNVIFTVIGCGLLYMVTKGSTGRRYRIFGRLKRLAGLGGGSEIT